MESNRIAIATRAQVRVMMLRFDDGHQTLQPEDRCMVDWTSLHDHAKQRQVEAERKKAAMDPKPWTKKNPERIPDPELKQNSLDMSKVPHGTEFRGHDGNLREGPERSNSHGDGTFQDDQVDPVGWPEENSHAEGTFSFDNWLSGRTKLSATRSDVHRTEEEIEASIQIARSWNPRSAISEDLLSDLIAVRQGDLAWNDEIWREYDVMELSFGIRRCSNAMHRTLIWNVASALNIEKNELMKQGAKKVPSGIRLDADSRRVQKRYQTVEEDLQKCKDSWEWHVYCNQQCYKDPIYLAANRRCESSWRWNPQEARGQEAIGQKSLLRTQESVGADATWRRLSSQQRDHPESR